MIREVKTTLANLPDFFPDYNDSGYEIAGLVWFQGFNDVINDDYREEYGRNLISFIRDVRKELGTPQLPVVIGELGMDGVEVNPRYAHKHYAIRKAQEAPSLMPEFAGTVGYARTSPFVVKEGKAYDGGYHYRGRADTFYKIGIYEKVLLYNGNKVRHYGLKDHKEYFAEGTEAYLHRNDFYPFVRAELKEHDPELHDLLAEVWGPLQ